MKANELKETLGVNPTSNVYKPTTNNKFLNFSDKKEEDDSECDFQEIFDNELDKRDKKEFEEIVMKKRK